MNQGFVCRNAHYNYVPTETAPGHASIYTGTTPAYHGIVGNQWFENGKTRYCVEDSTVSTVGSQSTAGARSPRNMIAPTFGDQLKLTTNGQTRIYGVSLKDRGAILPAGHTANGAFWYDGLSGKFVTSSYYYKEMPTWAQQFNNRKPADQLLSGKWETLLPIAQYTESQADDNAYEQLLPTKEKPVFPYDLKLISEKASSGQIKMPAYDVLSSTPFGNTLVNQFAQELITQEKLGKALATDVLAVSFSSTDIVGHAFGPQSIEVEDTYLRLDKELEALLNHLDKEVGQGNYVLFLSADHGGVFTPKYLSKQKLPSGYLQIKTYMNNLKAHLNKKYGEGDWIAHSGDKEVYLNRALIQSKDIELEEVQETVADFIRNCEGIFGAYTAANLEEEEYTQGIRHLVQNAFFYPRSADVVITHRPGWLDEGWRRGGTSHGTGFNYDTQVPVLFYGWKIPQGKSTVRKVYITDIAATLAMLLNIQLADATTGEPIVEIFGN
ncbi:MAG: alkaline phosphatase family protein [Bacteroidia bacterium]|nr:alkaline phosphatase family protein [Bacteroidia bacterium]